MIPGNYMWEEREQSNFLISGKGEFIIKLSTNTIPKFCFRYCPYPGLK
jgi:hypothetical protein